ncbi:hypothetical protein Sjap_023792 [Stephania japonica]|uniref:Ubiquitin fusion degradaton protein n=1 Tax=Stephania japonica TaxID=461633 RepID=A0AAP0HPJ6_9MAGN
MQYYRVLVLQISIASVYREPVLSSLDIDYPMLFELRNATTERVSHCGVLEFTAEEGIIYIPHWMMENLLLQEGDIVRMKNVTLPKGTYMKLQPHTKDFLDISDPKAILETTLRNFSCLTTGDCIMVAYNDKKYYIDIVETRPSNAISIIETDCEVDFAPPLDYKEPERPAPTIPSSKASAQVLVPESPAEVEHRFIPFLGVGRRLDGKPLQKQPASIPPTASAKDKQPVTTVGGGQDPSGSSSRSVASRQHHGKLVFGSSMRNTQKELQKATTSKETKKDDQEKKEKVNFQAFSGRKYTLKG